MAIVPTCSVPDCPRKRKYRDLCGTHYERRRRSGDLELDPSRKWRGGAPKPVMDRFRSRHVQHPGGCWEWTSTKDTYGYAIMSVGGISTRMHRWAYETFLGPIPNGLDIDHQCHNDDPACPGGPCVHRACVRPDHLVPRTRGDNLHRGRGSSFMSWAAGTCGRGHPKTEENVYWRKDRPGKWECRPCKRERAT